MKKLLLRLFIFFSILSVAGVGIAALFVYGAYLYLEPKLPPIDALKEIKLQVPLRIFTEDDKLISEFGVEKRILIKIDDVPQNMVNAIVSAEDDRFFEHPGVDWQGLVRAAVYLIRHGRKGQGGRTITMQVARNYLLTLEKTYLRKLTEIFLSLKIEKELSKRQILELYFNKIFLGNRAYGIAAAAQVYYGKPIGELTLEQYAMLAGLPKAPSLYNPIANPARALARRNYVLKRMYQLKYIDRKTYRKALATPDEARVYAHKNDVQADYIAEMVRDDLVKKYGKDVYRLGYQVHTTLDSHMQRAANAAVQRALLEYDRRHGFRGPLAHVELNPQSDREVWTGILAKYNRAADFLPALVLISGKGQTAKVFEVRSGIVDIPWQGMSWARPYITDESQGPKPKTAADVVKAGDVIYIEKASDKEGKPFWRLAQVPQVEGALISLDPQTGAIKALVGGFDFSLNKFNRVTQALRQPGSNFKPFIYASSLDKGFTTASIINDAPVVFEDSRLEDEWRPENYSGKFFGPTRLRKALVNSRNLVSIRLLRAIGVSYATGYVERFGFNQKDLPHNLSLALGTAATTPLSIARGYATFANGGYLIEPFHLLRVEDSLGKVLEEAPQVKLCLQCPNGIDGEPFDPSKITTVTDQSGKEVRLAPKVLPDENVYIMTSILRDVVKHGTGRKALRLGRNDLAGKTGTTNDQRDAWFSGFTNQLVTTVWVGFDTPRPLGHRETGAGAALPMWIYYMGKALQGMPEHTMKQPSGLVTVRIDPETGKLASPGDPDAIFEIFRKDHVPTAEVTVGGSQGGSQTTSSDAPELF